MECQTVDRRPVGEGRIEFTRHTQQPGQTSPTIPYCRSVISQLYSTYPLRLMVPKHASNSTCQWLYLVTFGGGLVGGDHMTTEITVNQSCAVLVSTQASTKVYHCSGRDRTKVQVDYTVEDHALLAVLPDPVVPYENSILRQTQEVHLSPHSNLILLDWMTSGRLARGEHFLFDCFHSSVNIDLCGKMVLRDAVKMSDTPHINMSDVMGRYSVMGCLIVLGKNLKTLTQDLLSTYSKKKPYDAKYTCHKLIGVSPLKFPMEGDTIEGDTIEGDTIEGDTVEGCIVKFAAESLPSIYVELEARLAPFYPVFGGNPFYNKY